MNGGPWLIVAGTLSAIAALLHIGCIIGGPDWYRFFGAGEGMAQLAARGSPKAVVITLAIALVLAAWSAYAFAGAGVIPRLPLMRAALVAISAVYLLRGLAPFALMILDPQRLNAFWWWSSAIVMAYGVVYAIGTWKAWPRL